MKHENADGVRDRTSRSRFDNEQHDVHNALCGTPLAEIHGNPEALKPDRTARRGDVLMGTLSVPIAQLSLATAHAQAFEDMIHVSGNINSETWVRTRTGSFKHVSKITLPPR